MEETKDQDKTREQLISELVDLRRQVTSLEASVATHEQAAEALRWAEAEWRSLMENAPEKITTLDREGMILSVNSTSPGRTVEEVVGTSIYNYLMPDEQNEIRQVLESVFQSGLTARYETAVVRADGTEVIYSNSVAPIEHEGQVTAAIFIATDITGRKRAEEALRESEARYRAISEITSDIAYAARVEPDGTTVPEWTAGAFARTTGFTLDELMARGGWPILIHPDDMPIALQHLQVHLTGEPDVSEYRIVTKDGETRWLRDYGQPVWDAGQARVVRIIGAAQDITERRQAEEVLRESEERFRHLFQNANEGITVVQDERVVFANPKALELLGCSKEELAATNMFEFVHPVDQDMVADRHRRRLAGETVSPTYMCRTIDRTGKTCWIENRVVELVWGGRPAYLDFFVDITDRKQAEEQLWASLREKEVMLREIHHRVRNNLAVISSLLDFQARYSQDEHAQEALHESRNRVHSMALVHEQLYRTPDLAQIDFAAYVRSLAENLFAAYQVVSSGVTLQLDVSDVLLEVGQAIPCGLIITELVTNALKHAFPVNRESDGPGENEIRVVFRPTAGGEYELLVSDNGIGLPPGFEFPSRDTLGLFLVSAYTRELKGTITWHTDEGTMCRVVFASEDSSRLLQDDD